MEVSGLMKTPVPFIMMGLYILAIVVLSYRTVLAAKLKRNNTKQNFEDFYTGNKSMPAIVVGLLTIVTFYSGTTFTGRVGFFYNYGVVALTTLFSSVASGVIMFFLAEKVWPISKKYHCSTLSDLLEFRYQSRYIKLLTAVIIVSFNIIWLITEIKTLGIIVNIASGGMISAMAGSGVMFAIIIAYVCTGGVRSVAAVDSFSSVIMLVGSVAAVVFIIVQFYQGDMSAMFAASLSESPKLWTVSNEGVYGYTYWFSSVVVSTIVMLVYPSNYMSICMGKSVRAVKKASLAAALSGPWLFIYGIIAAAAIGLGTKGITIQNPEAALLEMISYSGNGLMLGVVTTTVLAASLGTLDSTLISLSGILSNDIYVNIWNIRNRNACIGAAVEDGRRANGKEAKAGGDVLITRFFILLLGGMAFILSLKQLPLLVLMANYASNGLLQIVPAVIGGMYWKKATPRAAAVSMISGTGFYLLLDTVKNVVYNGSPDFMGGFFLGLPALLFGGVIFVIVSELTYRNVYADMRKYEKVYGAFFENGH